MSSLFSKYNFGMFNPTSTIKSIHMVDIGYHDHTKVKVYTTKPRKQFYSTFHAVLEGEGTLYYHDKVYDLYPGSVFYLPQNETYLYLPKPENPYKFVWIGVDGNELTPLLTKKGVTAANPIVSIKNTKKMLSLVTDFIEHNNQRNVTEEKMLAFFFSFVNTFKNVSDKTSKHQVSQHIEAVKDFIQQNYMHHTFSIHSIESLMHVSHSWLCALFKRETSMSMHEYLISVRLSHAADLLINSDLPINEISYMCGFCDALYFSSAFKKRYTLSPLNYRSKYKKKY
jgi:AraC family transcriptional regulator of arabinose operon